MPIVTFTGDQKREVMLPPLDNTYAGEICVHAENADNCDGVRCGARMESALSAEDYADYLECHPEQPPISPHVHFVWRGKNPVTRSLVCAVAKFAPR